MIGEARGAGTLTDLKWEIRRLHGCASEFEQLVTLPEAPGRGRIVVAVFALSDHPARRCYAWRERELFVVLHGVDVRGPAEAVRHVADVERATRDRWAQEYA